MASDLIVPELASDRDHRNISEGISVAVQVEAEGWC
jgi:hypothetical protein